MDKLSLLARVIRILLAMCRAARLAPTSGASDAELAGNAHGLSYAILATRWQRKAGALPWDSVYGQWQSRLSVAGAISTSLYGAFDAADRLELLTGNEEAFEIRDELCQAARQSIDVATYYLQADQAGWRTARLLADCARRGVRVRIVADRGMTERKAFENPDVRHLQRYLRDAGVDYRLFKDSARPYDACHRKLLIVDGETVITGGRNYANHYAEPGWRDTDLWLSGPSVAGLQAVYQRTFVHAPVVQCGDAGAGLFHAAAPAAIASNPFFIYLLECIRASRETLDIENAYYLNHPVLYRCLADACRRGVRVRLFTNSAESNDLGVMNYRLYAGFPGLIDAGVMLYLRKGRGRTLHSKYFVADGEWVCLGSSNLDFYSPRFCLDLGVHVRDARLAGLLTDWFEQGVAEAELLTDAALAESVIKTQRIGKAFDRWLPDMQ